MSTKKKTAKKEVDESPVFDPAIKELQKKNEALEAELKKLIAERGKLSEEVFQLKRSRASFKSANTVARETIKTLKSNIAGLMDENESLKKYGKQKDETIADLESKILELTDTNQKLKTEIMVLNEELEDSKKPWWKKLF